MAREGFQSPTEKQRCTWVIEGVAQCSKYRVKGEDFCVFHGPRHAEISKKGAEASKTLWAEVKAKARQLPAKDWPGYRTLVLAQIRDQLALGTPDVRGLSALLKNLERALEESQGDVVAEYRFEESMQAPPGERPSLEEREAMVTTEEENNGPA